MAGSVLLLPEHQIHYPAATDLLAGLAAVIQDVGLVAPGVALARIGRRSKARSL
jgi:hypothetical protein